MSSMISIERGHRKWLVLASFLLVAATLVSSMPVRVELRPGDNSGGSSSSGPVQSTSTPPSGPVGEFQCATCGDEIESQHNFVQLPCGHRLHVSCTHPIFPNWLRYGYNCPRCGPHRELGTSGRLLYRDGDRIDNFRLDAHRLVRIRATGDRVADDVTAEEIEAMFSAVEPTMEEGLEMEEAEEQPSERNGESETAVDDELCPICINNVRESVPLQCGHKFHEKCITSWFKYLSRHGQRLSCPVCRREHVVAS